MRQYRVLTVQALQDAGACQEQVDKFRALCLDSKSLRVTVAKARKVADKFDWCWASGKLLKAPAWAERVTAPALAEYERVTAPALAEYQRVTAPAWAEYERVKAPALAEYQRVTAAAWAAAYINDAK